MFLCRIPKFNEVYLIQDYWAPYEGKKYRLIGEQNSTIATAFSKKDFEKVIIKYNLKEYKPIGWEE